MNGEQGRDEPEALRRRLYQRDATEADRAAYAALAARQPAPGAPAAGPAAPPHRVRARGVLLPAGALLAAAAVALLVVRPSTERDPAPSALRAAVDVQRAALVADTTEAERDGFVAALGRDGPVGLPVWARGRGQRFDQAVEHRGRGRQVLALDLPRPAGRVEVLLVVRRTASAAWTLQRRGDATVDTRSLVALPGDIATGTLRYGPDDRPVRLVVTAPEDVRWDVAVLANG